MQLISTAIGLRVKDGVVFAVEKLVQSKLLIPGANRRIQTIDRHLGFVRNNFPMTKYILINVSHRQLLVLWLMGGNLRIERRRRVGH